MKVLLIDNYDSFTFNLAQALQVLGAEVEVHRNDRIDLPACRALRPSHVVISPGPGRPEDAGVSLEVIRAFHGEVPLLGVCLGHQAITTVFGGTVVRNPRGVMHGKASDVTHDGSGVYRGLDSPLQVARYHSLVALVTDEPPQPLVVTARTAAGEIMGVRHVDSPTEGVQFHPESILTPDGPSLLRNFLEGP